LAVAMNPTPGVAFVAMAKGPRNVAVDFGVGSLTHYGGIYLIHRFLSRIDMKRAIALEMRLRQRNNRYSVGEMVLALMYPMILGLERLETTQLLRQNGVFQYLTGLRSYPDPTTLRRFLFRIAPILLPRLRKMHDHFITRMAQRPRKPTRLIFDVDSTVLVLYGTQEQAKVGYNPKKRGRPSYHPLLCFEGITKDYWHGELRPGDAHTARGAKELLAACIAKAPKGVRLMIVRADKGFYDHKLMDWLEDRKARFVIVAKLTVPIKHRLGRLRYTSVTRGVEAAEFRALPAQGARIQRYVVIRRPEPEEEGEQLRLFKMGRYRYQVLVTNLPLRPLNLWRFYNDRAGVELVIKQLRADYAVSSIPTRFFMANEAYFQLLLLAYNVVNWFKRLCLPPGYQAATLQTLRNKILLMPAQLRRTHNRPRLGMPASGDREEAWRYALQQIRRLRV
jgi:hypothetical protein